MNNINQKSKRKHAILRSLIALCRSERRLAQSLSAAPEVLFDKPDLRGTEYEVLSDLDLYLLGISPIPSLIQNIFICGKLSKVYGDLSEAGIFSRVENGWRLDVAHYKQGFLLPLRTKSGLWYGLKVFRSARDAKPFYLKKREVVYA